MPHTSKCSQCNKRLTINATNCSKCGTPAQSLAPTIDPQQEKKSTIWAYVTGTLFTITGLGAFQIGILPAVMLIIGGILVLPFVRASLLKASGFATDKPFIIASTVLIIFGIMGYISAVKSDRVENMEKVAIVNE